MSGSIKQPLLSSQLPPLNTACVFNGYFPLLKKINLQPFDWSPNGTVRRMREVRGRNVRGGVKEAEVALISSAKENKSTKSENEPTHYDSFLMITFQCVFHI